MQLFPEKIHRIREERNLCQKDLAEVLSIDTPAYCRIEKGERRARREQVISLARYFNEDKEELLTLWLVDQVSVVLSADKGIAKQVLTIAGQAINE